VLDRGRAAVTRRVTPNGRAGEEREDADLPCPLLGPGFAAGRASRLRSISCHFMLFRGPSLLFFCWICPFQAGPPGNTAKLWPRRRTRLLLARLALGIRLHFSDAHLGAPLVFFMWFWGVERGGLWGRKRCERGGEGEGFGAGPPRAWLSSFEGVRSVMYVCEVVVHRNCFCRSGLTGRTNPPPSRGRGWGGPLDPRMPSG